MVLSFLLMSCASTGTEPGGTEPPSQPPDGHPALLILEQYQELGSDGTLVIPYFINLFAIDLLKENPTAHLALVRAYIEWYLDHLNYPDKYGITGSIYDYRIYADGREEALNSMDSVDSYSATFIMLINRYYSLSGESVFLNSIRDLLEDIIFHIPYLQQEDDLTTALPDISGRFLMDNCEALGGVRAFLELAGSLNWDSLTYYTGIRDRLESAIDVHLYDAQQNNYFWLKDRNGKTPSQWSTFYPDGFAQLFPILYDITRNTDVRNHLWNMFQQVHAANMEEKSIEQQIIYRWTQEAMQE